MNELEEILEKRKEECKAASCDLAKMRLDLEIRQVKQAIKNLKK